jgi:hypothetical protein
MPTRAVRKIIESRIRICEIIVHVKLTTVNATLTDGTGTIYRTAYLHFQLVNCGNNVPVVTGSTAIVQDSFDLHPATVGGSISASVLGNDQILCGGIASTNYLITPMKDSTHPLRDGIAYVQWNGRVCVRRRRRYLGLEYGVHGRRKRSYGMA